MSRRLRAVGRRSLGLTGLSVAVVLLAGGTAVARPVAVSDGAPVRGAVAAAPPARPAITKVLTFVVENHSLPQMKASMPFVYGLAKKYAYADHYNAVAHPSLPNYLAMVSGGTQGVTDDAPPALHPLGGLTFFDQALSLGKTATLYADSMRTHCQLTSQGRYAVKHNPWAYFTKGRDACGQHDVPVAQLAADSDAGTLPNAGMVVPNLVHDAHDAALGVADSWIETKVRRVQSGADWKSGHLAIVITADEDDHQGINRVLTVVASRYQVHRVVHADLTHYSLTRLYDSVLGAPFLGKAAGAASMTGAFSIKTAP
ncbi:alkaline phosphatase family protein [Nocardioides sp.]|uniref:alkaline phosphatase family protein n=1 Tax=Nocardioides sp. TaxID=35761 RepID=UPI0031FF3C42